MTLTQKVVLIALLVVGALCLIVGLTLMHHIGGFLRTVEEEREQDMPCSDSEAKDDNGGADRPSP